MQTITVNGQERTTGRSPVDIGPVQVDGTEIPVSAILEEAQNHPAVSPEQAVEEAARALVIKALLVNEAMRTAIEAEPLELEGGGLEARDDALIRALLEGAVAVPEAGREECTRYYENNKQRFRTPTLFEVEHILRAAPPDDADARASAGADADRLVALIADDPASFGRLAAEWSDCPSASQGGSLGQITGGQTVPEFERALEHVRPNEPTPIVVQTRYGLHVVRVANRISGSQLPFEAVENRIRAYLADACWQRAVAQYIAILAGTARITGVELTGSDTPLVQ